MNQTATIEERISRNYAGLSDKLQIAADFVAENPLDIATRSLRAVASTSGVSPATLSRLARALGYEDYEQMREDGRAAMGRRMASFSERAQAIRAGHAKTDGRVLLNRQATACIANIELLERDMSGHRLEAAVDSLHQAERILLVGSLGSSGFVDYFSYLAHWFEDKWFVAGRNGTTLAGALARLGPGDAVLAVTKSPYARRTVSALKSAGAKGVSAIAITDSHTSPALEFADHAFIVPTDSPHFFSSYVATVVLIETIVTMLLTRAGAEAENMIRDAETQIHDLGETWTT